jgi:hypothetical protein
MYIAIGIHKGAISRRTGVSAGKALFNFVEAFDHDPEYILTGTEANNGRARIPVAIKELKSRGIIK